MTSIDDAVEGGQRRPFPPMSNATTTATTADSVASSSPAAIEVVCPAPDGTRITLTLPDDFHHHFRDGEACSDVLRHASLRFGRAIAMPNLRVSCFLSSFPGGEGDECPPPPLFPEGTPLRSRDVIRIAPPPTKKTTTDDSTAADHDHREGPRVS
jgi:hypothetical protein